MRSTILILFVALMATSCTKPTTPNPIKTTSLIEFDFNGKHYKQTINKDGNEESGNIGTREAAFATTSIQANDGSNWSILIKKTDDSSRESFLLTLGQFGSSDYEGWIGASSNLINIKITMSNGVVNGTFSGKVQSGAVIKEITNGVITDVPYVNI